MGRLLRSAVVSGIPNVVLPVETGGTGEDTAEEALAALNGVPATSINQPNGVAGLDSNGKLLSSVTDGLIISGLSIDGPQLLTTNQSQDYVITDYDVFMSYTVEAISGNVSRVGDTISYTAPGTAGVSGFTLNNKVFTIAIGQPVAATPTMLSPANGSINVSKNITALSSEFTVISGSDTHLSTDWQLATDSGFSSIVEQSLDDTVNLTSWTPAALAENTTYFLRARHKGTTTGLSAWSSPVEFTTKSNFIPTHEEAKLTALDKASGDQFGHSIAVSNDGNRVVVGAFSADRPGGTDTGSVYIFTKSGSEWSQEAKLTASDWGGSDQFGYSVDIDSNGTRVAIGANLSNAPGPIHDTGAVYVFTRSGTNWTEEAKIYATDKAANNQLGHSVRITADGSRIIAGARYANVGGFNGAGAAYVFSRSGTTWSQEAKLTASDKIANANFAWSVSITEDGSRAVVGARYDSPSIVNKAGSAYVFVRSGTSWSEEGKLTATDKASNDELGHSIAVSSNGDRVAVSAVNKSIPGSKTGAVYIFSRSGTSWSQEAKLFPNVSQIQYFGYSISITSDGDRLIAGDYYTYETSTYIVAAYVFSRSGTAWTEENRLETSSPVGFNNQYKAVDITGDGTRLLLGNKNENTGGTTGAGAVYVFS